MTEVYSSAVVAAPIDRVWALAGDWAGVSKWHPAVENSELGDGPGANEAGATRVCSLANGATLKEVQVNRSDDTFTYTYSITDGPVPVDSHEGVVTLRPVTDTDQTFIEWTSVFEAEGDAAESIKAMFEEAIPAGLTALKARLE